MQERYDKVRDSVRQFLLVQFGLCTFHYDEAADKYTNRAFNFYVWPRPYARSAPDPRFLCQTSSIDFLVSQDFDFNKLFKTGVSYLNPAEAQRLAEELRDKQVSRRAERQQAGNGTPVAAAAATSPVAVPPQQKFFVEQMLERLQQFLDDAEQTRLELGTMSAFQRKLVYTTVSQRFGDRIYLETASASSAGKTVASSPRDRILVASKVSAAERLARDRERDDAETGSLEEAIGFTKVIQHLSKSGKTVVGHNMLLDMCHTVHQFVSPLPEEYQDFKSLVMSSFPRVVDTKLMAGTYPFREEVPNSALNELRKRLGEPPFDMPEVGSGGDGNCGYAAGSDKYHEAGYDAFVTGLCFIAMSNHLASLSQEAGTKHAVTGKPRLKPSHHLLGPFFSKINLMRLADVPYMDLAGEDISPDRGHVFHVTFPREWKTSDLATVFAGSVGGVQVTWIDDTSAFVALHNRELAPQVMQELNCSSVYTIMPYTRFKALQRAGAAKAALLSGGTFRQVRNLSTAATGITPTLEKLGSGFCTPPASSIHLKKKRGIEEEEEEEGKPSASASSAEKPNAFKRTKSVTEETTPPPKA